MTVNIMGYYAKWDLKESEVHMQYYIREIRPMIHIPYNQGCVKSDIPIIDENDWHNEDEEKELYEKYLPIVEERDVWADVRFDERFIKVELNQ